MALLEVSHLITHFKTPNGVVRAVNDVSFGVRAGETQEAEFIRNGRGTLVLAVGNGGGDA